MKVFPGIDIEIMTEIRDRCARPGTDWKAVKRRYDALTIPEQRDKSWIERIGDFQRFQYYGAVVAAVLRVSEAGEHRATFPALWDLLMDVFPADKTEADAKGSVPELFRLKFPELP